MIGVTRGVADVIRLGLDNAAGRYAFGQRSHEHFADEKTSELGGIDGQLWPAQYARARCCRREVIPSGRPFARGKDPGGAGR